MILSKLKSSHKFKFIIIGEGPEHSHLMRLIRQLNIVENVIMAGNVSDEEKFQILDLSDCYVSTATHEGFGLVFLEAMEFGIPVISYNRGGQNDFLIDGKTGFIVELGDRIEFLAKIYKLMNDPELYSCISDFNRSTVQNYYVEECAEKYISLFDETIFTYRNKKKLRY
jgi:glycosyltransferase involved in cell wall biosynthesis